MASSPECGQGDPMRRWTPAPRTQNPWQGTFRGILIRHSEGPIASQAGRRPGRLTQRSSPVSSRDKQCDRAGRSRATGCLAWVVIHERPAGGRGVGWMTCGLDGRRRAGQRRYAGMQVPLEGAKSGWPSAASGRRLHGTKLSWPSARFPATRRRMPRRKSLKHTEALRGGHGRVR